MSLPPTVAEARPEILPLPVNKPLNAKIKPKSAKATREVKQNLVLQSPNTENTCSQQRPNTSEGKHNSLFFKDSFNDLMVYRNERKK